MTEPGARGARVDKTWRLWLLAATLIGCHSEPLESGGGCVPSDIECGWSATASSSSLEHRPGDLLYNPPENALDGDLATHWSSGQPQTMADWFQLDFGQTLSVHSIELDLGEDANAESYHDFPRGYFVRVSDVPNDDKASVLASGAGKTPLTHIDLKGSAGRYVFIRQTAPSDNWWSIHELRADVSWPAAPPTKAP